jgi:hypothetical protein
MATLQFGADYWDKNLPGINKLSPESQLHLILSLVVFLGVSIRQLLVFIFETEIQLVKDRASRCLGYAPSHDDPHMQFPPSPSSPSGWKGVLLRRSVIRCAR